MSRNTPQILFLIPFFLVLVRCAQVAPLTGGPKDMKPPQVVESVPANGAVNFRGHKIVISFNEFIQVKDLSNQLIVSPLLKTAPEISANGKNLVISIEPAELRQNTTYRLFLGNGVADMNESNSIPNFEYVFSTGDHIDTLNLSGTVRDAFTGKAAPESIVTLYEASRATDSLPHKELPDYFARTNSQGEYFFRNLPSQTFIVYTIADKNRNFMLDGGTEKTGFRSEPLKLVSDSATDLLQFDEELTKGFVRSTSTPFYGMTQIMLNRKAEVAISALRPGESSNIYEEKKGIEKDTITLLYRNISDTLRVLLNNKTFKRTDTVQIALPANIKNNRRKKTFATNIINSKLPLNEKLRFRFNTWMDTSKVNLEAIRIVSRDTAVKAAPAAGFWESVNSFVFSGDFRPNTTYAAKIDTGAFFDPYGITNDSLKITFTAENVIDFGKLSLKMLFEQKQPYIVQLLNDQQKVIQAQTVTFSLSSSNAATLVFTDIVPGTYNVKILFDDNGNKKWDTGDVIRKKQPERVYFHPKAFKILSDWEVEEEIRVGNLK